MSSSLQSARGGSAKLNTGFYIPLVGLGTYKVTADAVSALQNRYYVNETELQVKPTVDAALSNGYRLFDSAKLYNNEPELGTALAVKPTVDAALSNGYRLFDSAKLYNNEPELGTALAVMPTKQSHLFIPFGKESAIQELLPKHGLSRSDVFITTKIYPEKDDTSTAVRLLIKESLENFKTDYIDMVLIHYPKAISSEEKDEKNPLHRKLTYMELEKLKGEGKIRSVGVSNYEVRHLEEIKNYGKVAATYIFLEVLVVKNSWGEAYDSVVQITANLCQMMPCVNQVEYHPHFTRNELKEYCKKEGIFFQAFASLARQAPALVNDEVVVNLAKTRKTTVSVLFQLLKLS
ncbi:unnamed protein product [Haemonchus placei]|uniref:Aldo_ket_red domain-containing protein n=1 Tax=Haemonchus placei TaxID=6290 RepID=A0A0N4WDE3_HAEPC|nr:unnamed protein product [Haemonchus placei]